MQRLQALRRHVRVIWELGKPRLALSATVLALFGAILSGGANSQQLLCVVMGTLFVSWGSAGLNMWIEREPDRAMERTASRPLPSGRARPGFVLTISVLWATIGVAVLATIGVWPAAAGSSMLVLYVGVYTPLKQATIWNTVVGAIPGAFPPLIGALAGEPNWAWAGVLFLVVFVWQIPHFLPLAILYADDYARGGFVMLPSTQDGLQRSGRWMRYWSYALLLGSLAPVVLGMISILASVPILILNLWMLGRIVPASRSLERGAMRSAFLASLGYLGILPVLYLFG